MTRSIPPSWIDKWSQLRPTEVALSYLERSWTWSELHSWTAAGAQALIDLGVRPGDRVAAFMGNRPEMLIAFLAASRAGAIFVPINHRLSAIEVGVILNDATPAVVLAEAQSAAHVPPQVRTVNVDDSDAWPTGPGEPPAGRAADSPSPNDPIALLYTSGTTGIPKGALHTHDSFAATAQCQRVALGLTPADRHLVASPLSFTGGILTNVQPALATGGEIILEPGFDVDRITRVLAERRPTIFMAVPAMLSLLTTHPQFSPETMSSLRYLGSGSAPVSPALFETYRAMGVQIGHAYGLTEGGGLATVLPADQAREHLGTAGRACELVEIRTVDPDRRPTSPGLVGELQQRGPNVMTGYWNNPDATAGVLDAEGWLSTGDLGTIDSEGYLTIMGRIKDVILSGGINIYPAEVEAALARHPRIDEVAVAGVPDPTFGETVAAYIVLSEPEHQATTADLTVADLREFCDGILADYKMPRIVTVLPALPRTASGKIIKTKLRT